MVSWRGGRSAAPLIAVAIGGVAVGVLGTIAVSGRRSTEVDEGDRQAVVHGMGHEVMPFALDRTKHVFEMTVTGGIQDVVVREPGDTAQIRLVRRHLAREAQRFARGDFSDPRSLHGAAMPGLGALSAGADRLEISYEDLPDGGRIRYVASDPALVTAIHRWFGAQLSDHGADATYR